MLNQGLLVILALSFIPFVGHSEVPSLCEKNPPSNLNWFEAQSRLSYSTDFSFLFESIPPQATQISLSVDAGFQENEANPRALRLNLEWSGHTSLFGPFNVADLDFFTKTHAKVANGGVENLETLDLRQQKHLESLDRFTEQNFAELAMALGSYLRSKDPAGWARYRSDVRTAVLAIDPRKLSRETKSHWFVKRLLSDQKLMQVRSLGATPASVADSTAAALAAVSIFAPVSFGGSVLQNFPKFPAGVGEDGNVQWALSLPYWSQVVAALTSIGDAGATAQVDLGFLPIASGILRDRIAYAPDRNLIPTSEEVALLTRRMMALKSPGISATRRRLRYRMTVQIEDCRDERALRIKARGRFLGEFFRSDARTTLSPAENSRLLRQANDSSGVPLERTIETQFGSTVLSDDHRPRVMNLVLSGASGIMHALKTQYEAGDVPVKDADGEELLILRPDETSLFSSLDQHPFAPIAGPPSPAESNSMWAQFLRGFEPDEMINGLKIK